MDRVDLFFSQLGLDAFEEHGLHLFEMEAHGGLGDAQSQSTVGDGHRVGVLGDEGLYGLAELRYRMDTSGAPIDFLQLYGFLDGGYVSDIDQTVGEGSLFSGRSAEGDALPRA